MGIIDITEKLGGHANLAEDNPAEKLHKAWELSIGESKLILKRYGSMCHWNKLVLERNNQEVYRIEINEETRQEFFHNVPFRNYQGDNFSFIEYINMAAQTEQFPQRNDAISKGLEEHFVWLYEERLRHILCN